MKIFRFLPVAALIASAAVLPSSAQAATTLQPGAAMYSGGAGCTMNFVYDGVGANAGRVFIGTAAHCVTNIGDDVEDWDGAVWGDVAYIGDADVTNWDFAFVEVRASELGRVSAGVKGHPAYPTGFTAASETVQLDEIQFSGFGLGFELTQPTQEERFGFLMGDDTETWRVSGPLINGDSGGPLVHRLTGKALGIESRLCLNLPCTDEGPTLQGILAKAASVFPVALRTV